MLAILAPTRRQVCDGRHNEVYCGQAPPEGKTTRTDS